MVKITPDTVCVPCPVGEKRGEKHDIDRDRSKPNRWSCTHCGSEFTDEGLQAMWDEIDEKNKA